MNVCLRRETWTWVLSQKKARQGKDFLWSVEGAVAELQQFISVGMVPGGACKGPTSTHGFSHNGIKPSAGLSVSGGHGESSNSRWVAWGKAVTCVHNVCHFDPWQRCSQVGRRKNCKSVVHPWLYCRDRMRRVPCLYWCTYTDTGWCHLLPICFLLIKHGYLYSKNWDMVYNHIFYTVTLVM